MEWRKTVLPIYEISEYGDLRLLTNRSNLVAGTILKGSVKTGGYKEYHVRWEGNEHRYELMRRVRLWRFVSGQTDFDVGERFLRRIEYNPAADAEKAVSHESKNLVRFSD